tara:strand:+ start:291 stop:434 length:144 start_codon:yes stop_codon:yes gene_type:complete
MDTYDKIYFIATIIDMFVGVSKIVVIWLAIALIIATFTIWRKNNVIM